MDRISDSFDERLKEIEAYLDLLEALERQIQTGPPTIGGSVITTQQQKILYSSVYLQLYNLVEATATWCLAAVTEATTNGSAWTARDLEPLVLREWARSVGRSHVNLNYDHRLNTIVDLCSAIMESRPLANWDVEKGGGGNWNDKTIEKIAERIGCDLPIDPTVKSNAKRPIRDNKNALKLVQDLRNELAHGSISFEQCGESVTVLDLRELKDRTTNYLREVVKAFEDYIDNHRFLISGSRPALGGTP